MGGLLAALWWQHGNNKDLEKTIADQQCKEQQTEARDTVATGAAEVTEKSVAKTVQVVTQLVIDQKAIDDEVERRVAEIRKHYEGQPPAAQGEAAVSISRVRIDSLWDTYCAGDAEHCARPAK
jgi:hypothetical protein